MIYRETKHIGKVMKEKEYEGTPEEIAELIKKTTKVENIPIKVNVPDLSEKINEIGRRLRTKQR